MRHFTLIILFFNTAVSCRVNPKSESPEVDSTNYSRSLAYIRGEEINYYFKGSELNGTLPEGDDPDISPTGSHLAYTEYYKSENPNAAGRNRRIVLFDMKTGVKRLIETESEQSYGAVWSPNGQLIAFSYFNKNWNIAIADTLKVIKVIRHESKDYHGLSWTADSKMILAHDLDTLFFIDTAGFINQKLSIQAITNGKSKSSLTAFTLTTDKEFIVFNGSNSESTFHEEHEYHADLAHALYKYDLKYKTLQKLTPNDMHYVDYMITGDSIFFSATRKDQKSITDVYKMSLKEPSFSLFIKNGRSISVTQKSGL